MASQNRPVRIFDYDLKNKCWNKAQTIEGRDPDRWRYDAAGNPVLKCLKGCMGPLCHEYDHIDPYSKGGKTDIDNCQILQTRLNRLKGNKKMSIDELKQNNIIELFSSREMDLMEMMAYGDIKTKKVN
jgi:hypothetical protein